MTCSYVDDFEPSKVSCLPHLAPHFFAGSHKSLLPVSKTTVSFWGGVPISSEPTYWLLK